MVMTSSLEHKKRDSVALLVFRRKRRIDDSEEERKGRNGAGESTVDEKAKFFNA